MKPLWIFGFAITLSFLAPLAQAAPVQAVLPEPASLTAPTQSAAAEQRDSDRASRSEPVPDSRLRGEPSPVRAHNENSFTPDIITASDADQASAAAYDDQSTPSTDVSDGESVANLVHYSMEDLANAAASLDAPYDATHFSMDDIGGL